MKISYNWLREFLQVDLSPEDLARHLLLLGLEVAAIQKTGASFSGVVVAEILDIQKHPNADRLSLCSVTDGNERLSIVCGATNIAVGQRVPLARPGATLAGGRLITRSRIRGVDSQGMICSAEELGLPQDNGGGIKVLPPEAPLGHDAASLLSEQDAVMEVEITSNRPDLLSHYGLARELGIYFRKPIKPLEPAAGPADAPPSSISVAIEARDACARYIGRAFDGVTVGPSPDWMAQRLERLGLRPINTLVDITHYVLLELGHPLHVFDADKLEGQRLVARYARDGERLRALGGRDYALSSQDLVIADAARVVAIAGIMGGEETGVTATTTRVLLESAQFAASRVRKTSQRLRLRSDSSYRFERGSAPQTAALASARAAELIRRLCGSPREHALAEAYPSPDKTPSIRASAGRINQILGTQHKPDKIEALLRDLSESLSPAEEGWRVIPWPHRLDLRTVWDLAEEIGRHLGYDAIGSDAAPVRLQRPKSMPLFDLAAQLRGRLAGLGFLETCTYDFLSSQELARCGLNPEIALAVVNPLSEDWTFLRPNLVPGLLRSAAFNFRRGARGMRLFELGKVYRRDGKEAAERLHLAALVAGTLPQRPDWTLRHASHEPNRHFYEAKGAIIELLQGFGAQWGQPQVAPPDPFLHPRTALAASVLGGEAGWVGLLHPSLAQAWDLPAGAAVLVIDLDLLAASPRGAPKLKAVSPYPSITRDLSIAVPEESRYADIEACLLGLPALTAVELIDRLSGEEARAIGLPPGKASLTLRLTFNLPDRTLRDEEVNAAAHKGVSELSSRCGAVLRG